MRNINGQRGSALLVVLIVLGLGSLVIVPTLNYTATALQSQHIQEQSLSDREACEAAVMDAMWQLQDPEVQEGISDSGEYSYDYDMGVHALGVVIRRPSVDSSDWQRIAFGTYAKLDVEPNWLEASGETTFYYVFRFVSYISLPFWRVNDFRFELPEGLNYVAGTAADMGPDPTSELHWDAEVDTETMKAYRDGNPSGWTSLTNGTYQENPTNPPPGTWYLTSEMQSNGKEKLWFYPVMDSFWWYRTYVLVFQVDGCVDWGLRSVNVTFGSGSSVISIEPTGTLASSLYNVVVETEDGRTIEAVVALPQDGEPKLISYQVVS